MNGLCKCQSIRLLYRDNHADAAIFIHELFPMQFNIYYLFRVTYS